MYGVVLAAGRGTRMRPLTDRRPKPLLPVGDRSLLEQGVRHRGRCRRRVRRRSRIPRRRDPRRDRRVVSELSSPLRRTGGGVGDRSRRRAGRARRRRQLPRAQRRRGRGCIASPLPADAEGTAVAATEVVDPRAYGVLSTTEDGSLAEIVEKPDDPPTNLANVGCYAFTPEVFESISIEPRERTRRVRDHDDDRAPPRRRPSDRRGALRGDVARRRSPLGASGSQRTGAREAGRIRRPDRRHGRGGRPPSTARSSSRKERWSGLERISRGRR